MHLLSLPGTKPQLLGYPVCSLLTTASTLPWLMLLFAGNQNLCICGGVTFTPHSSKMYPAA